MSAMNDNPYSAPQERKTSELPAGSALPHDVLLSGSMSIRDVLNTQILILRKRWFYAAVTLTIYVAFVLVLSMFPGGSMFGNTFLLLGLVIMPAILPLTILLVYGRLKRDADRKQGIFAVTESRLTNAGIHTKIAGKEDAVTIEWSAFSSFLASPQVVLLFLAESNDHLILARSKLVNEDDWQVLQSFFAARFARA